MKDIKKSFCQIVVLLLMVILSGCSPDDSDVNNPFTNEKTEAPANPTGEFKFYKGENVKWSFKVQPTSDPSSAVVMINSHTALVDSFGSFYYKKTGETTAELSCFFTTSIFIGGNKTYQWNQYELVLTFLSAHHGIFQGKQMNNPEDKGTTIEGYFVYDSDLELEEILNMYDKDQNSFNWDLLIGKKWMYSDSEYSLSYQFFTDGTFKWELKHDTLNKGSGNYSIDKKNNIITLDKTDEFKVYELTDNCLVMVASDLGKDDARTFVAQDNDLDENPNEDSEELYRYNTPGDPKYDRNLTVKYENIDVLSLETNKYGSDVTSSFESSDYLNSILARLNRSCNKCSELFSYGWAFCIGSEAGVTRDNAIHIADVYNKNHQVCDADFYTPSSLKEIYLRPFCVKGNTIYYYKARKFLARKGGINLKITDKGTYYVIFDYKIEANAKLNICISYADVNGKAYYDEYMTISGGNGTLHIPLPIDRSLLSGNFSLYLVDYINNVKYRTNIITY